jgi:hypothetical protein
MQQEGQLNDVNPGWVAPAMDIVTLIKTPEQALGHLRRHL